VQALESKENQVMDFRRPVRCVVLDPDYSKNSNRRLVSGGMAGQLILSEKGIIIEKCCYLYQDGLAIRRQRYILAKGRYMLYHGEERILHGLMIMFAPCSLVLTSGCESLAYSFKSADYVRRTLSRRTTRRSLQVQTCLERQHNFNNRLGRLHHYSLHKNRSQ
jgi:hypothetical protein